MFTGVQESANRAIYDDKVNQILRFLSSDIAAIAGYHQYKDKCELLEKYLYQDLQQLLYLDASNIGMELVDKEQEVVDVINQLPKSEVILLNNLREKAKDKLISSSENASSSLIKVFHRFI
jgi:3-phosphoglycerate kinase